jgi:hypothetical protein
LREVVLWSQVVTLFSRRFLFHSGRIQRVSHGAR